jgi:integrase
MRASEAAGLHWNQVNLKKRVIFRPDTKNKVPRWVPLTKELAKELSKLKKNQQRKR